MKHIRNIIRIHCYIGLEKGRIFWKKISGQIYSSQGEMNPY